MRPLALNWLVLAAVLASIIALAACGGTTPTAIPVTPVAATVLSAPASTATPLPVAASPTPPPPSPTIQPAATPPVSLWVSPDVPAGLQASLALPTGLTGVDDPGAATLYLQVGDGHPVSHWVYALVAPFPTIPDGLASSDLLKAWSGEAPEPFAEYQLLLDEGTLKTFTAVWGPPAAGAVQVVPPGEILDYAWAHRPSWVIVPFEALEPRWKVLEIDGQSPLRKEFEPANYALTIPVSLLVDDQAAGDLAGLAQRLLSHIPASNRDPSKLTTVVLTGVTALVRGTANIMYAHGITYPAQDIRDWLRGADITHISNEVPFAEDCPLYIYETDLRFCTHPSYIGLLEDVGADIIELTGDHFADWGPQATLYTLELYRQRNWLYYGGGANLEEGRRPVTFEHNGNRLAFIGCNAKG
ncbi:MAG: hypothetical protein EHM70_04595, partial [Chloroflexota bacterium]